MGRGADGCAKATDGSREMAATKQLRAAGFMQDSSQEGYECHSKTRSLAQRWRRGADRSLLTHGKFSLRRTRVAGSLGRICHEARPSRTEHQVKTRKYFCRSRIFFLRAGADLVFCKSEFVLQLKTNVA